MRKRFLRQYDYFFIIIETCDELQKVPCLPIKILSFFSHIITLVRCRSWLRHSCLKTHCNENDDDFNGTFSG